MKNNYPIILLLSIVVPIGLFAQNNTKSTQEMASKNESYVLADLSFVNDAVFMGRRDSIAAPYIFPSLGYYDKSGVFIDVSASYLIGSEENRIDLFLASAGYLFSADNLSGGISGTAYFFNGDSYNVQSEILGDLSGFLSYDFKVAEASLLASTYFNNGSSADFFTGLMLGRTFYSSDKSFLISPSVTVYSGSQYFYQEYYSTSRLGNRKSSGKGQGSGVSSPAPTTVVEIAEASKFKILNIAIGLPLQYYHKSFIFSFTPTLSLPQSPATITTADTVITEDLESVFYFSAGIAYWFNTTKKAQ